MKLKRNITFYKMQTGASHAQNLAVKKYTLKKNSYMYIQSWCIGCGGTFVAKTPKLQPTKKTYYPTGYYDMRAKFLY